eukprot:NODE_660_length_5439_cov_0.338577.p3 type:complete len:179 gc:universal NODE_660_length_5439_cov_0.338577:240-776(+)
MPGTEFEEQVQTAIAGGKKTAAAIKKHLKKEYEHEDFDEDQEDVIKKSVSSSKKRKAPKDSEEKEKKERKKKKLSEQAPSQVSEELRKITKVEYLPRQAVLKLIWKYIKENDCKDPEAKKLYQSDDVLRPIYGDTFEFAHVSSGLTQHLTKVEVSDIPTKEWEKSLKVLKELELEAEK